MGALQHRPAPRDRVIAAARSLFASQGFHQTPVSELATVADVSVGLIYRLFEDKSDVIRAIVRSDAARKAEAADEILQSVRRKAISIEQGFVQLAIGALSETDEALSFEILAEAHRDTAAGEMIDELCRRYRAVVRELAGIASPNLSELKLDGAEEVLLGLMFGLGHRRLSSPRLAIKETAELTAEMIMAALTTIV